MTDMPSEINYTYSGELIRGSRWPPWDGEVTVTIKFTAGWPIGAELWTWLLRFSRENLGGTADLEVTADSVTRDDPNTALILKFIATPTQTLSLPPKVPKFYVDISANDGVVLHIHDATQGYALVRLAAGHG